MRACLLLLLGLSAGAQPVDPCEPLLTSALAVPYPALRGDLLLKTLPLCNPLSRALRQDTLDQVLQIAPQAPDPYPRDPVPVGFTDTEPALSAIATTLGLDQLSLQTRALTELVDIAPAKARDWFDAIHPPQPVPLTCDDYQVARLVNYYSMLRVLSDKAFSGEEIAKGVRDKFISSHLLPVNAPVQLLGAVRFLSEAKLDAKSLELFLAILGAQVESIEADDRAFSVALLTEQVENRLKTLQDRCRSTGVDPSAFLATVRRYYARHLAKPRCADVVRIEPLHDREKSALEQLDGPGTDLATIRPSKLIESKPPRDLVVDTPQYAAWVMELNGRLKADAGSTALAVFDRVATQIEDWKKPDEQSEPGFFQIKALVLYRLMQFASTGEEKVRAAQANASLFAGAGEMKRLNPAAWLQLLQSFLRYSRSAGEAREQISQMLENNRDITLSAYARLDRALNK